MTFLLKTFRALLLVTAILTTTALLLGYFGSVHPSLDSLAHFRLHLAAVTALAGLLLMLSRRKAVGVLFALAAAIPLVVHMDYFGGKSPAEIIGSIQGMNPQQLTGKSYRLKANSSAAPRYRMMHANLRFDTSDTKDFLRLVGEAKPDVLTLNEVSAVWLPVVEILKASYPQQLVCDAPSKIGGVAILSKRPFVGDATNGCTNNGVLALQHVDFGGRVATVGTVHLLWPWPHRQPQQITEMREQLRAAGDAGRPVLVAGDLNAAPWSHAAKRLAAFLNAEVVTVPWGGWVYHTALDEYAWLGLPIDNVFAQGVAISSATRGRAFGSDHLPVIVEFSVEDVSEPERQTVLAN
jgi:endonuclease/exonuclease/phosphatase (EEP) superfamily protein YafD